MFLYYQLQVCAVTSNMMVQNYIIQVTATKTSEFHLRSNFLYCVRKTSKVCIHV